MKSFLLGTVATIALCAAAWAADPGASGMNKPAGTQSQSLQGNQHNAQVINPSDLNPRQISLIQRELNDQGFTVGKQDGVWGPRTQQAIRTFQQQRNISTAQPLNQETLSALGVNFASQQGTGNEGTTGSGARHTDEPANPPRPDAGK
jgi:peptidoglycan hydrolase-like protein with peptidoglycan-binding domain